jgi:hypothetical protein
MAALRIIEYCKKTNAVYLWTMALQKRQLFGWKTIIEQGRYEEGDAFLIRVVREIGDFTYSTTVYKLKTKGK